MTENNGGGMWVFMGEDEKERRVVARPTLVENMIRKKEGLK